MLNKSVTLENQWLNFEKYFKTKHFFKNQQENNRSQWKVVEFEITKWTESNE